MKSILFYWSRGAETRVRMLHEIEKCGASKKPCFSSHLARRLAVSHVAVKKHLDLLAEEGYVRALNPEGKPVFLELTDAGRAVLREFSKK